MRTRTGDCAALIHVAAAVALAIWSASALLACGESSPSVTGGCAGAECKDGSTSCGPGTTDVGGVCLPDTDATSPDSGSPGGDAAADAYVAPESSTQDSSTQDAPVGDAAQTSDPCLGTPFYFMSCDPTCPGPGGVGQCPQAKCGPSVTLKLPNPPSMPFRIRTPASPGVDPNCAAECPSETWVYGLGFQINDIPFDWTAKVDPPWELVTGATGPYCADPAFTPRNCATVPAYTGTPLFIMTKDPQAPARDVLFDSANALSCP